MNCEIVLRRPLENFFCLDVVKPTASRETLRQDGASEHHVSLEKLPVCPDLGYAAICKCAWATKQNSDAAQCAFYCVNAV
jgi:hypothetical protein